MQIVDAQVHVWAADSPERPWPIGRTSEAQRPYPVDKESVLLQMDLAGVSRAVLVPPSWEGDRNDLALEAASIYPDRFAVMGRFALDGPQDHDRVATWKQQPGMLGMRFTFHNEHNRHLLTTGVADWLWPAAERAGIPIMVYAPGSLDLVDGLAERHPGIRFVIDHAGVAAHGRVPEVFDDMPKVRALARHPNVAVKASGLPALSNTPYPFPDTHPYIRELFDSFGPTRTFWGTDLTRMPCTYYECITLFTYHLPWLAGEDLELVMGRALCNWLAWPLSG
ncbi:MAG: amidohydrolase family protein [Dehalococcoidia bacterium]|nr:amidohydrolase [Dehalococcoidia bacterium]MCB9485018.1 amidohydrolase [Thermoflexaceae bacterium]